MDLIYYYDYYYDDYYYQESAEISWKTMCESFVTGSNAVCQVRDDSKLFIALLQKYLTVFSYIHRRPYGLSADTFEMP